MQLRTKCPHCFGTGCDKCERGQIMVELPEDDWYTRHCLNPQCGFDNGACQGNRVHDITDRCVMCGSGEVAWIPMCESSDNPPWKETMADKPFAKYLISLGA